MDARHGFQGQPDILHRRNAADRLSDLAIGCHDDCRSLRESMTDFNAAGVLGAFASFSHIDVERRRDFSRFVGGNSKIARAVLGIC